MDSDQACSVCLQSIDDCCATLPCSHKFHTMCLLQAYSYTPACPLCRGSRVEKPVNSITLEFRVPEQNASVEEARARAVEYRNRVQHTERSDPRARQHRHNFARSRQRMIETNRAFERRQEELKRELQRTLNADAELRQMRDNFVRARRSFNRYRLIRERYLDDHLGDRPPSLQELYDEQASPNDATVIGEVLSSAIQIALLGDVPNAQATAPASEAVPGVPVS